MQGTNLEVQDEAAIYNNFKSQENCWNKGDLICYMEAYSQNDSIRTISRVGVTYGYENILQQYQQYYTPDKMGQLHFDKIKLTRLSNEYYYVVGRFNLIYEEHDRNRQGYFSVLMQKVNGNWLMISDHSS